MPFGSIGSFHAMARGPAVMPMMNIAPVGITVLSSTATSITISFTPPDGVVTGYVPFVNGVAGTGSGTHASYTITGLTAGQTYSIMMHANMSIGGTVTNFLPTSIPGCLLWLDAADASTIIYASGSSVSQWNDKSGNGYNFTAASGTYPTYSSNAMSFVGTASSAAGATQYFSNSSIPFPNTYSIFVVAKGNASQPSTSGYNYILKATTTVDSFLFFGSKLGNFATFVGPTSSSWNDTLINSPTTSVTTSTILLGMINDGATYLTPYANGTALNTKNGNAPPFTGLTIGDPPGQYHGQCWNGTVNEILVFGSVLTNLQRQQVEGYLAWKWNLKSNLPASHPYYATSGLTVSSITFSPRFIPGCALWFDAADTTTIVKTGSSVSQWNDKSGNGYSVVQPTSGNQPTHVANSLNGYGGIQFANTRYLYQLGSNMPLFSASSANSVYIVARNNSSQPSTGWGLINTLWFNVGGSTADTALKYHFSFGEGTTNGLRIYVGTGGSANTGVGQSTAVAFGANAIVGFSMSSATTLLDVNGSNANYAGYISQNTNLNNKWFMFGDSRGGHVVDMIIYEMIGFNTQLSISDQKQIDGYLASKWGIQSSLSTSHPFYSVPALTNAYSVFSPISIPGLKVWWDGADPNGTGIAPVNGASIATWVDKSGSGYNATASVAGTYSSSPVGVNFGTTGYYTSSYPANPTNESCFIVFNKSSNNQMMMIGTNAGGREVAMQNGTTFGTVNSKVGWSATMSAGSATGVTHIGEVFVSGGTSTYVNFNGAVTLTGPSAVTAFTSGILTNLGREAGAEFQYLGYIQEILFYNSVLTLAQRQPVEGYLAWKWGVQTNLPVAHPYYSTSALAAVASVGPASISYTSVGSVVKSLATIFPLSFYLDNKTFLINYYRFEAADITGTSLLNFSSGSYDATLTSATITSTVGKYKVGSSALALTSQYATINSTFTTAQTFSNGVSFAYWFYTPAINGYQRTFDFGVSGTSGIAMYTDQSTGQLGIFIPSTTVSTTLTGTVVTDGVWRHTVFTINTSGLHTIYINGAIVKTVSSTFPSLTMTGNFIGKSSFSGDVNFTGGIDDFRVYNCVLSANDAKQLYAYTGAAPSATYFPLSPAWTPSYSSLVAYFMFDETSGSTTAVEQIGANNGTVVTGVTFGSTGKVGTCASFNGTGYLNIPFQTINNLTSYTICVWVYINSYSSTAYPICAKQSNGTASHHILTIGPWSGTQDRRVYFYPSSANGSYYTNVTIETGVWTHIAVTGTGSNLMFYINGKLDSNSYSGNFSIPNMTSGTGCAIGYAPGDLGGRIFTGQMDDFAVWNVALTSDNIATIYSYQSTGVGPPTGITPVSSSSSTSLTVSFTAPVGSAITYTPYVNGVAGTGSGTPSSYTFTGLTAGTRYSVSLSATSSYSTSVLSVPYVLFSIPSGVMSGSPTIYYPFWIDTKDYATGTAVTNATFNGTTPPSISTAVRYKSYAQNSLYSSNGNCNMSIPSVTINSSVGFTVCFWFYLTSATPGMLWTANANPFSTRTFIYWFGSYIRVNVNGADNNIHTNISLNTWYFITLVQPAGGVPYSSLNNGTNINLPNYVAVNYPTSHHYLYGDPYVGSNFGGAIGYMNNFYFFNRALSASEITAIYNQ